jgi:3-hydroxybutyryl-CoA dehydrogenase
MTFQRIGIVGAGQMGNGIAQVFAVAGMDVVLCDPNAAAFEKGMAGIRSSLERLVAKEKISAEQVDLCLSRIQCETELDTLENTDMVIEAVIENEALKQQLFASLDQICQPNTILASNTSSISITRLAAATQRPGRVIGTHFMNPVPVMKLVEVIRACRRMMRCSSRSTVS